MIFSTSAIFAVFVFGNLALGRPKNSQQTEKKNPSNVRGRDLSGGADNFFVDGNDDVTASASSTGQYVAYSGDEGLIDTSDPNDLNAPMDSKPLVPEINHSDNELAINSGEPWSTVEQSPTTVSSAGPMGIPLDHFNEDVQSCREVVQPSGLFQYIIYNVQQKPSLDITVAAQGTDTSWERFGEALKTAGMGYAVHRSSKGVVGIVNQLESGTMTADERHAYYKQGEDFFKHVDLVNFMVNLRVFEDFADIVNTFST